MTARISGRATIRTPFAYARLVCPKDRASTLQSTDLTESGAHVGALCCTMANSEVVLDVADRALERTRPHSGATWK